MIEKKELENGLKILYKKRDTQSVTIQVSVKSGCIYEPDHIMGVSHFIEHMLFNGTTNRTQSQILNEIEDLGGELNAATTQDRTFYYIKILNKHFDTALNVLSDMIQNSNFPNDIYEREKGIILDEINMVYDTPRHQQWVLFAETLFENHPASKKVLGTKETITNMKREDLVNFYKKMYVPNNLIVSVVGNVENVIEKTISAFGNTKKQELTFETISTKENSHKTKLESRQISQSYFVMGYSIPKRTNEESYAFDVIKAILGRGQSGWIFDEVRNKRGLAYDAGVYNDSSLDTGFLGVYVNSHKKNFDEIRTIIFEQFQRIQTLTEQELENAKNFIEGEFILGHEDTEDMATEIAFWEMVNKAEDFETYTNKIRKVTLQEVKETAKKYLTKEYSEVIIQQK